MREINDNSEIKNDITEKTGGEASYITQDAVETKGEAVGLEDAYTPESDETPVNEGMVEDEVGFSETEGSENDTYETILNKEGTVTDDTKNSASGDVKIDGVNPDNNNSRNNNDNKNGGIKNIENNPPEKPRDINEVRTEIPKTTTPYYEQARAEAKESETLAKFTDHTQAHIDQVAEKSQRAADAMEKAYNNGTLNGEFDKNQGDNNDRLKLSGNIDKCDLEAAAQSHDIGMAKGGYAVSKEPPYKVTNVDGDNTIRENHSINSALRVLENRKAYEDLGVDADKVALEVMAHSKSGSGVKDLCSKKDWSQAIDRMEVVIQKYNDDHPDNKIEFNKDKFMDSTIRNEDGSYKLDEKTMGEVASSTLALRMGDANRDTEGIPITQSGEMVHMDTSECPIDADNPVEEVKNAKVYREDENGERTEITDPVSKKCQIGEANIPYSDISYNEETGKITNTIEVAEGSNCPKSTQAAIRDRIAEMGSAKYGAQFDCVIEIDKCNPEHRETIENSYEKFKEDMKKDYPNVSIKVGFKEDM